MSTGIDPTQQPPAPPAAPEAPPQQGLPQPPVAEPQQDTGFPQPPTTVPAPTVDAQAAIEFYERFSRPDARGQQMLATGRQYGYIPEGIDNMDEAAHALAMYAEWKQMQGQDPSGGQQPPPVPAQPPMHQPVPPPQQGYQGYQDPGLPPAPIPQQQQPFQQQPPDIDQLIEARFQQHQQQQTVEAQQQQRLANLQQAVEAATPGWEPHQRQLVLQNVALGIDTSIEQGRMPDFEVRALTEYAGQVIGAMRSLGATQNQADMQQQIQQHRAMAPRTTAPTGPPGAPGASGARGMEGVRQRIAAAAAARGQV